MDLYLRSASEADLKAALPWALDAGGEWVPYTAAYALDLIGPIVTTPAVMNVGGEIATPAEVDTRFHANLRLMDETLVDRVPEDVRIEVSTPSRVWL